MSEDKEKKVEENVTDPLNDTVAPDQQTTEEEVTDSTVSSENAEDKFKQLQNELAEKEDQYLRLQAEMQNMRRRSQKEREDDRRFRSQSLATDLIPVLDNLERALSIEVEGEQGKNLKKGIEMVLENFKKSFEQEGIAILDPVNEPFDPQFHEAYTSVPAEKGQESGIVAQVFEKGYSLNGRILRAAKVSVTE